jgi:hypothetical protein
MNNDTCPANDAMRDAARSVRRLYPPASQSGSLFHLRMDDEANGRSQKPMIGSSGRSTPGICPFPKALNEAGVIY